MNYVSDIDLGNRSLSFIDERLRSNNYRGVHFSQHNRYDLDKVIDILKLLNKFSPNQRLMQIRTTDNSKRPNLSEEKDYALFCNEVKRLTNIGTQDAMRKNIFVDFARMGLINRYSPKKIKTNPFKKSVNKYVNISDLGIKLINAEQNILERQLIFSKALNRMLQNFIEDVLTLMTDHNVKIISFDEFMLFVTAINCGADFSISIAQCTELINEYRLLSRTNKNKVTDVLKTRLVPEKFFGDKKEKRDYHNWANESQQLWNLFQNVPYFIVEKDSNKLLLICDEVDIKKYKKSKMKRSQQTKNDYFKQHDVQKTKGYELDHIIPLLEAENIDEYHILDSWKNLLYIDGKTHAIKSQSGSRYYIFSFDENNSNRVYFSDVNNEQLIIDNGKEALFDKEKIPIIFHYNQVFLKSTNQ